MMTLHKFLPVLLSIISAVFCHAQKTTTSPGVSKTFNKLPDGGNFDYWEDKTVYTKIIHVAQLDPNASDRNDGSAHKPFLTIQRAADIAMPGDLVLIGPGVYRETVRPMRGGNASSKMICYRGTDKEKVIITGTEIFEGHYKPSEGWVPYKFWSGEKRKIDAQVIFNESKSQQGLSPEKKQPTRHSDSDNVIKQAGAVIYMFKMPRNKFVGVNPFAMVNGPAVPWVGNGASFIFMWAKEDTQKKLALMKRGMLFCDGKMLRQVSQYVDMAVYSGSFFVEDDGLTVHVRMADDGDPKNHQIEYTAREQCFAPENRYNAFIKIENISFQKAGNGFAPPQRGIVSTNCGNHFIINNCVIEDANGIGLDIGFELPSRHSHAKRGYQVVSNCEISRCGMAAICGTTGSSDIDYYDFQQDAILIYKNKFFDNCWQNFSQLHESATIKMHHLRNSILAGNYIENNLHGHGGIWLDAANENVSINENVVYKSLEGGIYIEASTHLNEIANNIIVDVKELGIRGSESDHIRCSGNIILGSGKEAIGLAYGGSRYFLGQTFTGKGVEIMGNIISQAPTAISIPIKEAKVDRNIYGTFRAKEFLHVGKDKTGFDFATWQQVNNMDREGKQDQIKYTVESEKKLLKLWIGTGYNELKLEESIMPQLKKVM